MLTPAFMAGLKITRCVTKKLGAFNQPPSKQVAPKTINAYHSMNLRVFCAKITGNLQHPFRT